MFVERRSPNVTITGVTESTFFVEWTGIDVEDPTDTILVEIRAIGPLYVPHCDTDNYNKTFNLAINNTNVMVSELNPYSNYSVTVRAITNHEPGPLTVTYAATLFAGKFLLFADNFVN